jgi:hypothetical protein
MVEYSSSEKHNYKFLVWQLLLFSAICWTAIEAPLSFVLNIQAREHNLWWDGIICLLFLVDVALNLTGFYEKEQESAQLITPFLQKEKRPYHKSIWLPLDLVSSIPFDILAYTFGFQGVLVLRLFRLLRVVRMLKVVSLYNSMSMLPHGYKVGLIFCSVLIVIHWIACGWMFINPMVEFDAYTFYNKSLYWSITTLTTIGYGDITPTTNTGRIFTMIIMILGVGTYGVVIGNVSRLIIKADRYKEAKKEKFNELGMFMKHYNIPTTLQRQVFSFYHHLLTERMSDKDNTIISELPHALQSELNIYMKIKLIKNVHIFKDSSTPCLKMIAKNLQQSYYSPNEPIIQRGDVGEEMFIIAHGEVEVFAGEKVVASLKEGQFFGEIALLEHTERTADVRSKSYCDLYTLHKDDFLKIVEKFPALHKKFKDIYTKRKTDSKKAA